MSLLSQYFPEAFPNRLELLLQFENLLVEWNTKINVISRKDIDSITEKHILHSLSVLKFFDFTPDSKIADVGSGGGFPGIPIAIMCPNLKITLIESVRKKTLVLNDIVASLGLDNVVVINNRAELLHEKYDFITGRAVTAFPDFVTQVIHLVSAKNRNKFQNGIIYLKGGDFDDELSGFSKIQLFSLSSVFKETFFETKKLIYLPISR